MKNRQTLILLFTAAFILAEIFSSYKVKSNSAQPPAEYADNPPGNITCTYCHTGVPIRDSTNFVLSIGTDTSNLSPLTSGVTTYIPNQTYYLRIQATKVHPRYGFEITAEDASNNGTTIGNFIALNSVNTSYVNTGTGQFIGHKNANTNNQWTFQWTSPATNIGPITFYWAGNDANGDGTQEGDSIYVVQKTISANAGAAINDISTMLSDVKIFPSTCSDNLQLQFNLLSNNPVNVQIFTADGRSVAFALNENLSAGNYRRSIDVVNLASGIYLLKLQVGDAYMVRKFIRL